MKTNSKNEFKFVVTGVDLTEEQQEQVSRAIAQAGALALGGLVPRDAVGVRLDPRIRWYGRPIDGVIEELQEFAFSEAGIDR
ncbi:hypothetical protein NCG97_01500 [Streptomyces lydicamycinicus]|uniref:Uncharacterized protein n=1 Tax=Streptomyces lydicamycinicus TaxID=1546107 RepID=A0A0P4RCT0_9ACTN|nr:hypothetical protein [Streptomyces lydicamycinicus]URZ99640.1 hypothetical protein NCG97_01500 [Streptomyces lydicamycinicus]GAO10975.1 hypothetical protein TPA0598_07_06990 [Streptomyces lydicamycinicus]